MIFCVEDDKNIRELVLYTLKTTGYTASGFCDADELFAEIEKTIPLLILLDIMLPKKDGIDILKELKSNSTTKEIPVILLTAKTSEFDKVSGLDLGADDYITKPFGMMELISRIKSVLRRCENRNEDFKIVCQNIVIDTKKHTVLVDNSPVKLAFKEYEILKHLMQNQGIVFTRDNLLNSIWGYEYDGENRTVDVHIRTLRQKLGVDIIHTIRNVGYKIGD